MKANNGFTLIELLVVLIILSLVTSISLRWIRSIEVNQIRRRVLFIRMLISNLCMESIVDNKDSSISIEANCRKITLVSGSKRWEVKFPSKTRCYLNTNNTEPVEICENETIPLPCQNTPLELTISYKNISYTINLSYNPFSNSTNESFSE